jgi:hypothetical protein
VDGFHEADGTTTCRQDALDGSRHNVVISEEKKGGIQKCISIGNLNTADTDSPQMPETDRGPVAKATKNQKTLSKIK